MNGILLVDKPESWTSNDVVQKLRGILRERRIGHAGTLDPMATGLLTVFVGRATRAVEFAEADEKRYVAAFRPGVVTDTQDITGEILAHKEADISAEKLEHALSRFRGPILQTPPMYSAVKINGQRLYKAARQGKTIERPAREITVYRIEIVGRNGQDWILDIRCSKGTYIRTLCHDIGEQLGCGGCLASLRRIEAGIFRIENAHTLEKIAEEAASGNAESLLIPVDSLFKQLPAVTVSERTTQRIRNGNAFRDRDLPQGKIRLYAPSGEFLALGEAEGSDCRIIKSFFEVSMPEEKDVPEKKQAGSK